MEFQPSADMSWQNSACNELNQAATYPSLHANVHKADMTKVGCGIREDDGQLMPYSNSVRTAHLDKLQKFKESLVAIMCETTCHTKVLEFMVDNGIRQLGKPHIGNLQNEY